MEQARLKRELERRVEELGYEFVELETAGSKSRPIFRLRVDLPDAEPGRGVTLDDCARVSRALEPFLDADPEVSGRYVLEVSSPGVERPLVRPRDWERFAGQEIAVIGRDVLADRAKRLEGTLLGTTESEGGTVVRLQLPRGDVLEIPLDEIARAHLVYRWQRGRGARGGP